jgi:hypothetical protein
MIMYRNPVVRRYKNPIDSLRTDLGAQPTRGAPNEAGRARCQRVRRLLRLPEAQWKASIEYHSGRRSNQWDIYDIGNVHRLTRRPLHRPPRRRLPRRAADDGVSDADREEVRAPVTRRVARELYVPALVRPADDDEPDAGPVVEPLAHEPQLWRVVRPSTAASAARRRRPRVSSSTSRYSMI